MKNSTRQSPRRLASLVAFALPLAALHPARAQAEQPAAPEPVRNDDGAPDSLRLRFGFGLSGGAIKAPTGLGPAAALSGRLGLQFNHYLGVYYQNMPVVTFAPATTATGAAFTAGFIDYNSVLVTLTLLHLLEIGAGPSYDYVALKKCNAELGGFPPTGDCADTKTASFGLHGRVSLIVGGPVGNGARRSGFSINADVHPLFLDGEQVVSLTVGIGSEWY